MKLKASEIVLVDVSDAKAFNVDVADKNQIDQAMIDTEKAYGGVDILVANAGINIRKAPEKYLPIK